MKIHELKILSNFFGPIKDGNKLFEIRKNDRNFEPGDVLLLREITTLNEDKQVYTGQMKAVKVTYITDYKQQFDYVVMGISII